ncbi:TetR family transcriptional regulator [Nocardia alni]|uniref:TetR family transcriptional regulator n=1 Tax=Nocardia alni TaxID=2815723 RepID=UPI0027E1C017|nr:TetR family transcriptional regulator [Nocardia alni]
MVSERQAAVSDSEGTADDRIRRAVVELVESEGYDGFQMREVARSARVSLAKIYKLYDTRDELISSALDWWMQENRYAGLEAYGGVGGSVYEGLMWVLRRIFEPWESHPALLVAYFRARAAPGSERLIRRGFDAVVPAAMTVLADVDADFVADLESILSSLVYGLLGRFAGGEIEVRDIVLAVDRTVYWLTAGYDAVRERR